MDRFFFAPPEAFSADGYVEFSPDEERHIAKVLRLRSGSTVTVVDGQGLGARVQIEKVGLHGVRGRIISMHRNLGEPTRNLTIGLALLKQQTRYTLFLEKAVELGVTRIIPLITERTESRTWRAERARKVMIAALKQCNRSRIPDLQAPTPLPDVLLPGTLLADPHADKPLRSVMDELHDPIVILIGPEGGFTQEELSLAKQNGGMLVQLAPRCLRSETAAICGAAAVCMQGGT